MPIRILVVEDNHLNQKILSFYLKKHFDIRVTSTGEEALEILNSERFDVVLMDLMLPGMDGYEATRQIRQLEKGMYEQRKIKIIALTANTLDNDKERCLRLGMDGYLSKPFEYQKLHDILVSLNMRW